MMMPPLSLCLAPDQNPECPAPDQNPERTRTAWGTASQDFQERHFEQYESHTNPEPARGLLNGGIQICPIDSVKRHSVARHGLVIESIYASAGRKIELRFDAPVHLLVMYDEGARREGETSIRGLDPSTLQTFANKLTFVPADHAYHEWHETSKPTRVTYLYLDPGRLKNLSDIDPTYVPRILFEDPILWKTAGKLKTVIETGQARSNSYAEALVKVLLHELPRSDHNLAQTSLLNRGGLATWQMRAVTNYVEEHLGEPISLALLAQLVRLSQHHFCRAFKNSFGISPHQYHVQRRIERAKALLVDRANSVTDVALIVGYSQASALSVAFRKTTGRRPKEFRRDFS
jgi:AraC family transcriptional regulator